MSNLMHSIRHAARRVTTRPGFAAAAIVTLASGIAATTTIFSVVDAVLLRPLPWREPDRLVTVFVTRPHWRQSPVLGQSWNVGYLSWPIFKRLQNSQALSEVGVWSRARPTLNADRNELVYGLRVSASLLPMLGVQPHAGRFFLPAEDDAATDAVIVSFEAWQRRYGGNPQVLGQRVSLDETPGTIVGVLPPGFDFDGQQPVEFVLPWGNLPASNRSEGNHFMRGIGRLRAGVPLSAAVTEIDPLVRGPEKPEEKAGRLVPLVEDQLGQSARPLWFLLGAAGLLLLIACANVAGLQFGEARARMREMAVRQALGGSRGRLAAHLLIESLALTALATAMSMLLVVWLTPVLVSLTPDQVPRVAHAGVNIRVFVFAVIAGGLTSTFFGVWPALALSRVDPVAWIRDGGRSATRSRSRAHNVLVAFEVALAVVLVAGASMLGETLLRMIAQPLGFDAQNLVVTSLRIPSVPGTHVTARATRTDQLVQHLAALPGVAAATATSTAPFSGSGGSNGITLEGNIPATANRHIVTQDYFRTLGIPVVKGRAFDATDQPGAFATVVSDVFEQRFMNGNAVGQQFTLNGNVHRVVGVVPAAKHRRFTDDPGPAFYALNRQLPQWTTPTYVVRTTVAAPSMLAAVRRVIEEQESRASIITLETMTDMVGRSVAEERYRATLSGVFAVVALLLAVIGLYGLIARGVDERRREIGVRLALGAEPRSVTRLVLRQALALVAGGLMAGIAISLAGSTFVASLLYGVTPTSPHIFVAAGAVLGIASAAAAFVPARRAARTDPMVAMRDDA